MTASSRDPSDADAIARSFDCPEAFEVVFTRHFDALHRYLERRLGLTAADELASEIFARAFEHRRRFDLNESNAAPWLYGIASNLISRHRRDERRALHALARAVERPDIDAESQEAVMRADAEAHRARLAQALADLKRGDRDALLLAAWADLTYAQIAVALAVPVGTVRSRINRARSQMAAALGESAPAVVHPLQGGS